MLWGRAAARCELAGCNRLLSFHPRTKESLNLAETAHIIGFSANGPRGEADLSEKLAGDIDNLMLLCGDCHRLVDNQQTAANYPVRLLRQMKLAHERRVELCTRTEGRESHVLLYDSRIGEHYARASYSKAVTAMSPDWYPAERTPLDLGMSGSFEDAGRVFWSVESAHLRNMISQHVRPRLASGSIQHLSVFAVAPQALLMLLGSLLSDIPTIEVYQLHREPQNWRWQGHPEGFEYIVQRPSDLAGQPALVLALSATISDQRISAVLGGKAAVWRVTVPRPHNDFLKSRMQLRQFRQVIRPLMDEIKARHGEGALLHVFPAAPVAIAVEMGRVIMPKADLRLRIYDQNRSQGGYVQALELPSTQGD